MAKKTVPTQSGRSKVWDERLPRGAQHTIYAPANFFELWVGDGSTLKKVVNDFLVGLLPEGTPKELAIPAKALPAKTETYIVSDDDI